MSNRLKFNDNYFQPGHYFGSVTELLGVREGQDLVDTVVRVPQEHQAQVDEVAKNVRKHVEKFNSDKEFRLETLLKAVTFSFQELRELKLHDLGKLLPQSTLPVWGSEADLQSHGFRVERRTEGERLAAFFETSEHTRYAKVTRPKWEDLDALLPTQKTWNGVTAIYWQHYGKVLLDLSVAGTSCSGEWDQVILDVSPNWRANPWLVERYEDLLLAQKLVDAAIPNLPRVPIY